MKDIIEFPVVGTGYIDGACFTALLLQEGAVLQLEHEPLNPADPNAIKILAFAGSEHIGYVPNRGFSCSHCWTPVREKINECPNCGCNWDYIVKGGLATRIISTQALTKPLGCYVKRVDQENKFSPVVAKLILE